MSLVTCNNIIDIMNIIEQEKYPYEEYEKFKNKYIETLDTNNTERIIKEIKNRLK